MDLIKEAQCKALLAANEKDGGELWRYKTETTKMRAAQDLRLEREQLLDELARITGVSRETAKETPAAVPPPDDPREPVHH